MGERLGENDGRRLPTLFIGAEDTGGDEELVVIDGERLRDGDDGHNGHEILILFLANNRCGIYDDGSVQPLADTAQ